MIAAVLRLLRVKLLRKGRLFFSKLLANDGKVTRPKLKLNVAIAWSTEIRILLKNLVGMTHARVVQHVGFKAVVYNLAGSMAP